MNNRKFRLLSAAKKQEKQAAVLRYRRPKERMENMCWQKQHPNHQIPMPPLSPEYEADLLRRAFGLIQRRITEHLSGSYPEARWVWETPNAQAHIAAGDPVYILLNRAGGFRRAEVRMFQLQFRGLKFDAAESQEPALTDAKRGAPPQATGGTDFSLLAYEWVEAHLLMLNERGNEAVASGEEEIHIAADELPDPASWEAICAELIRSGFREAAVTETGIITKLPDEKKGNDK
jgi:hypothetical protein